MKKVLIIGGGFAGCTSAHQLALQSKDWDVTIVESAPFLGAGVRTSWFGGHPYTFGPRHFLTQNRAVYEFLNKYCPLRLCADHQFLTYVECDNAFYNFPIHKDDIQRMPDREKVEQELKTLKGVANANNLEDYWIGSVGQTLYDKYIKEYSKKMWQIEDNTILDTFNWSPKGVALKEGDRAAWDTAISAYPYAANGYDDYFELSTKEAKVLLSTTIEHYDIPNKTVVINGNKERYDVIINTVSPDIMFDYIHGELFYLGRDLHTFVLPVEHSFPENVYFLYYANNEKFTRLVEYKKFTHHKSPTTLIGMEIPSANGKHYPFPTKAEQAKAQKYFDMMPDNVFSIGRAGAYRYGIDIDDTIEQAMGVVKALTS